MQPIPNDDGSEDTTQDSFCLPQTPTSPSISATKLLEFSNLATPPKIQTNGSTAISTNLSQSSGESALKLLRELAGKQRFKSFESFFSSEGSEEGNFLDVVAQSNALTSARIKFETGDVYEGTLLHDIPHGHGKCIYTDGSFYEGGWLRGARHGFGKEVWADGSVYEGMLAHGKIQGKGKLVLRGGLIYEGEFKNNEFHGFGVVKCSNGVEYQGEWLCGRRHGKGRQRWPDGREFEGQFEDDVRHGTGESRFIGQDKVKLLGSWNRGEAEGKGFLLYIDTMRIVSCEWEDGFEALVKGQTDNIDQNSQLME